MANTRAVKQRITTASNISKITKAMEMVSASKMRKAQQQALQSRQYTKALGRSLKVLAPMVDESLHPLLKKNDSGRALALVISTDRGLCGSLNQTLFKELTIWLKQNPDSELITVGKKAMLFCQFYGLPIFAQFTDMPDTISINDLQAIITLLTNEFVENKTQLVEIFYMDFVNTLVQKPFHTQLLPIAAVWDDADQTHQQVESNQNIETNHKTVEYIFEPSPQTIFNNLLPFYVENTIFQAFLEAKASEHSARMVTMKNASENASELIDELKLVFNKQRQMGITNELLDITTATMSLKN